MSTDTRLRTDTTSPPKSGVRAGRVTPIEASALMPALAAAVADAAAWAHRSDGTTRTYPA